MEDMPTFNSKQMLVIDLKIESGDKDTITGTEERGELVAVFMVPGKKKMSSTTIV
jgi:hypothetical protein